MNVLEVLVNIVGSVYLILIMSFVGEQTKGNWLKYLLGAFLYFTTLTLLIHFVPGYIGSTIEPYISTCSLIVFYMVIFKSNLFDTLFYMLFGFVLIGLFEIILLGVFHLFGIDFNAILTNYSIQLPFEIIKLIFVFILTRTSVFRIKARKIEHLVPYIIAALLNVFIFYQLFRIITNWLLNGETTSYMYIYAIFLVILLTSILLIRFAITSQNEITQLKSYKEYEKMIIPLVENSRSIEHDFKNHLSTLKGLVQNNNIEEFDEYLSSINDEIRANSIYKICENPVMGALLQEKANFARENNIEFDIKVFESKPMPESIKPHHVIIVVSNLIDNAFEEVLNSSESNRKVSLVYSSKDFIEISLKNSLSKNHHVNLSDDNKRGSTKGESRGYGLSNVKKVVKKYNGEFKVFHMNDSIEIITNLNP